MENQPFWWYLPGKMVIFMGYVSLPEGISRAFQSNHLSQGFCSPTRRQEFETDHVPPSGVGNKNHRHWKRIETRKRETLNGWSWAIQFHHLMFDFIKLEKIANQIENSVWVTNHQFTLTKILFQNLCQIQFTPLKSNMDIKDCHV